MYFLLFGRVYDFKDGIASLQRLRAGFLLSKMDVNLRNEVRVAKKKSL